MFISATCFCDLFEGTVHFIIAFYSILNRKKLLSTTAFFDMILNYKTKVESCINVTSLTKSKYETMFYKNYADNY